MSASKTALKKHQSGFNCCQCVLASAVRNSDVDITTLMSLSAGFGGGVKRGELCGALSGAIMAFGLIKGVVSLSDLTKQFITQFEDKNGAITCRDILHYDISQPEGLEKIKQQNLFINICRPLITKTAEQVDEFIKINLV